MSLSFHAVMRWGRNLSIETSLFIFRLRIWVTLSIFWVLRWLNPWLVLPYPSGYALVCGLSHGSKWQASAGQKSHCTYFVLVLLIYDKYVLYCDRQWNTLNKWFLDRLLSLTTLIFITSKWWSNMVLFSLFKL